MLLDEGKRNWELKFNTGLALIDLQTKLMGPGLKQSFSQSGIQTTLYEAKL